MAAAGCHAKGGGGVTEPPADEATVVAGSRLRPVYVQPADGAGYFSGVWYDTQLGIRCVFTTASDGSAVCVPATQEDAYRLTPPAPNEDPAGTTVSYADADCTQPVIGARKTCVDRDGAVSPCDYVGYRSITGCTTDRLAVLHVVASLEVPVSYLPGEQALTMLFQKTDAGCAAVSTVDVTFNRDVSITTGTVFRVEDFTDQFVAGARHTGTPVAGLAPMSLDAQDGASQPWGFQNQSPSFRCGFIVSDDMSIDPSMRSVATDGTRRCLPIERDVGQYQGGSVLFSDAQCSLPALGDDSSVPCKPWDLMLHSSSNRGCPLQFSAWEIGDWTTGMLFSASGGTCTAATTSGIIYGLTEILPSQMAAGRVGDPVGDGRIQTRWIETSAGRQFWSLWDQQLGVACAPTAASDGTVRCLPITGIDPYLLYADASCTTPIGGAGINWCMLSYAFEIDSAKQVHAVLGPYTGPVFQSSLDVPPSACFPVGPTSAAAPMFNIGPPMPATDFVAISQTIL
jgi:hypothetical protein